MIEICFGQKIIEFFLRVYQNFKGVFVYFCRKKGSKYFPCLFGIGFVFFLNCRQSIIFSAKNIIFISLLKYLQKYDFSAELPNRNCDLNIDLLLRMNVRNPLKIRGLFDKRFRRRKACFNGARLLIIFSMVLVKS